ncbi:glucosidase 2 subunit beta [Leptopilina boulardi]|uniref:glucosidase 2 subunit beta n=1 Tax=Leptopilina boulardi TaxID=63433 RepID=UPI0021F52B7C|nr:glucosidase 2 subunit beta [Leptopilina boulardi]
MNSWWLYFVVSVTTFCFAKSHVAGSKVISIRGIHPTKIPLYSPDRDFHCLDGSLIISFNKVNDDFCDCVDGSDEPGTSACSNGSFYCQNLSYKPKYIPSGRVNDGVCDCCDASDEYESNECVNNCYDLGHKAKLEADEAQKVAREGNDIRNEMIAKGKQIKNELQQKLSKLRTDHDEAELIKKEKEGLKKDAEEKEKIALDKYKPPEPEQIETENDHVREERLNEAEDYFRLLDSDASGTVTIVELQTRITFDKDRNGEVSEEEALYFLNNQPEITMQEFIDSAWANIKPFIMLEKGLFKPAGDEPKETEAQAEEQNAEHTEGDETEDHEEHDDHDDQDDHEGEEEGEVEGEGEKEERTPEPEEPASQYDEETQALVDQANTARNRFNEADKAVQDLLTDIKKVEEKLSNDFGVDGEFTSLDEQCFDFTDLEYVYTLCIFGKATQRSKSGGSDVNLGSWNDWHGPQDNRYSKMKYDHGYTCWNGPARSTIVTLLCGKENKLLSVTEPSRCEYAMEFLTPSVCKLMPEIIDTHDEL